jgi:glycosyltransferase involved in cell wall biosynthesis
MSNILIISRARYKLYREKVHFNVNEGTYIDSISTGYDNITVYANLVDTSVDFEEKYLFQNDIKCNDLNIRASLNMGYYKNLIKEIKHADLIYLFYPVQFSILVSIIAKIKLKRIIAYNGSNWSEIKSLSAENIVKKYVAHFYYKILEYLSVTFSDVYFVNNNTLLSQYGRRRQLVKAVPFLRNDSSSLYRRENTCTGTTINILSVNVIKKGKGVKELIEGFYLLLLDESRTEEFILTIVGRFDNDDPFVREVLELISELNLTNNVILTGMITDYSKLLNYYRQSDLFVLVTYSEGFPRVIWEAFSQSLPVICSPYANILMEFQQEPPPVCYLEEDTPEDIKEKIIHILTHPLVRGENIKNGMSTYIKKTTLSPQEQFLRYS